MISEVKTLTANRDTVPEMMDFISALCESMPPQTAFDITLACEELLVNIASYAYPNGEGEYTLRFENDTDNRKVTLIFEDTGIPFNPLSKEDPDLTVPMAERKIGGLGIMMVRKRMDSVGYVYAEGKNILTVMKGY